MHQRADTSLCRAVHHLCTCCFGIGIMDSFVAVPNGSDFPLNNLPFGACTFKSDVDQKTRLCVAIGEHVVDLGQLQAAGCFTGPILSQTDCFAKVTATARMSVQRMNRHTSSYIGSIVFLAATVPRRGQGCAAVQQYCHSIAHHA